MPLRRRDRQDVLYFTGNHGQVFDVQERPGNDADAARNASSSPSGIRSASDPASIPRSFRAVSGKRARASSKIPFARTDDPSVAAGKSFHSSNSWELSSVLCFEVIQLRYHSMADNQITGPAGSSNEALVRRGAAG